MPTTTQRSYYPRVTVLSEFAGRHDAPGDRSGGLDHLVAAAKIARDAYDELDYATDHTHHGAARELLQIARDAAYETWQAIERGGLPLLQRWQRETLGYSEDELSR